MNKIFNLSLIVMLAFLTQTFAVTSEIVRQNEAPDFADAEIEDVILTSQGNIVLGKKSEQIEDDFKDVWAINTIVVEDSSIYFGTSPNGAIYKYDRQGRLKKLYPLNGETAKQADSESNDPNQQANDVRLTNEHIFAMGKDSQGNILAGISGRVCRLIKFENDNLETIFEPADANYIFAIATAEDGSVYIGTGPEGIVYEVSTDGSTEIILDSRDTNIMSLICRDGDLYAGTDTRGVIYKVDLSTGKSRVLYDSDQDEIVSLALDRFGNLYAAGTSANVVQAQRAYAAQQEPAGRPDIVQQKEEGNGGDDNGDEDDKGNDANVASGANGAVNVQVANTQQTEEAKKPRRTVSARAAASKTSKIYKINPLGFVTEVFSEPALFFQMSQQDTDLMVGTGNRGQLFKVDPTIEESAVIYQDRESDQITAVISKDNDMVIGTANPAKLIIISEKFATKGIFESKLIDAGQPAKWGTVQMQALIPEKCTVKVATRTGNIDDVNDPAFSDWSNFELITGPVKINSPVGRYLQYKLSLSSETGVNSPFIREVAVAYTVPNISPRVEEVSVSPAKDNQNQPKQGYLEISYTATDDNNDPLIYEIQMRKIGRENWITIQDEYDQPSLQWDTRTVEDGRYELRVIASDIPANNPELALTGSRISDPIVVDNSAPEFSQVGAAVVNSTANLRLAVTDELSAVTKLQYTVDSNEDWKLVLPVDDVYDTLVEEFQFDIKNLEKGKHVIALKALDSIGNISYNSFVIEVK